MVVDGDPDARRDTPQALLAWLRPRSATQPYMSVVRRHRTPLAILLVLVAAIVLAVIVPSLLKGSHGMRPQAARGPQGFNGRVSRQPTSGRPPGEPTLIPSPRPVGRRVSVTIAAALDGDPGGRAARHDFLGLSFEMRSLPLIASWAGTPTGDVVVKLLRSLGAGVLRFGGVSADESTAWVQPGATPPPWAKTAVTARDFVGIARLARATGWRVLLTVNLGHYNPQAAAHEAAAAHDALGSALTGIEIGNEPDRYVGKHLRPRGWDFASYRRQAETYRAAIEAAAPGMVIAGPDPATGLPGLIWLRAAAATLHPQLLTDHYYPLSSCGYKPTVGELLSPNLRHQDAQMLAKSVAIAHATRSPLRIDETNSISCEGRPGVSDTFAASLWALAYIVQAIEAGVVGVNFHDLLFKPGSYSPLLVVPETAATEGTAGTASASGLASTTGNTDTPGTTDTTGNTDKMGATLSSGVLDAQPEWYALLAARALIGTRPLPAHVAGAARGELTASAFVAPDGSVRVVLIDYDPPGSRPLAIRLALPHASSVHPSGAVLRLTGPSPAARSGVRLGGRLVARDGSWSEPRVLQAVYDRNGALSVQLAPSSAAIVTLYRR